MPLLSLHTVELQSALQFLPLADLLSFSRCSPATRILVSSPFVFLHVAPVAIAAVKLASMIRCSPSSRLLRFVPLSVRWRPDRELPLWPQLELLLETPLTVREFDAAHAALDMELWHLILRCPWARGLRVLKLHESGLHAEGRWDRDTFDLIAGLPQLTRLDWIVAKLGRDLPLWPALAASSSLTHTTIDDRSFDRIGDAPFNLQAPKLTSLHLRSPRLLGQSFDVFFAHESMRQLRSLHLQGLRADTLTSAAQAIAGLTHLIGLEQLTVQEVLCSAWLFDELHRLPSLRLLTVYVYVHAHTSTSVIPTERYVEMLRRSPQLCCVLIPTATQLHIKLFYSRWAAQCAQFAEFGARLQVLATGEPTGV